MLHKLRFIPEACLAAMRKAKSRLASFLGRIKRTRENVKNPVNFSRGTRAIEVLEANHNGKVEAKGERA